MRTPIRSLSVIAAVALVPLALVGCGGGSKEDPNKVLRQTFGAGKKVTSGKINLQVQVTAAGIASLNGPVTIALTGPFQSQGQQQLPKFDLDFKLGAAGRTFTAGAVSTGDRGFIKFQGSTYEVSATVFQAFKRGFEQARAQRNGTPQNPSFSSLGIDPRKWLKSASTEGDQDVAGTSTIHVSSQIDIPKLLDGLGNLLAKASALGVARNRQLPTSLTAQQKRSVANAIQDAKIDVYSGKSDKILRKLTLSFKFKVPQAQQQRANGLKSGKIAFDLEIADLNQPQTIATPTSVKPFSQLSGALSGLIGLGGLGGAGSSSALGGATGSTGGTTGSAGSTAKVQAYAKCVTDAAGDVAKAQACAKLLTP